MTFNPSKFKKTLLSFLAVVLVTSFIFLSIKVNAVELLSDTFTGTTIDTGKWTETDPAGIGGTVGNIRQNGNLSLSGSSAWGQNYVRTSSTYDRTTGDLAIDLDMTLADCGSSYIPGIGYGDPGVLTGGGQSYTVYYAGGLFLSRQNANSNAENNSAFFTCTPGVPFHIKLVVASTTGAQLYVNGSGTAATTVTGGTFNNKGFFLQGYAGTSIVDNVVVSGTGVASLPGAPTSVVTTPASAQMGLSWSAPLDNGGAAVTDYIVEYKRTASSTWSTFADGVSAGLSTTVTGLTNAVSYDFRIFAINSVGTSTASATSTATPVLNVPTAPQTLIASNGNSGQSTLVWVAPSSNGGATVTDYAVEYKPWTDPTWTIFNDGVSTATTTTVTGLVNGTPYNFKVSAINSVGTSTASNVATGTPSSAAMVDDFTGTTIDTSKWTEIDPGGLGGTAGNVQQNGSLTIVPTTGSWSSQNGITSVSTYDRTNGDVSMQFSVTRSNCGSGVGSVAMGYGDMDFTVGGSSSYIFLSNNSTWELYYWTNGTNQVGSPQTLSGITSCTNGVPTTFKLTALQTGGASIYVNGSVTAAATLLSGTFTNEKFWFGGLNEDGTVSYDDISIVEPMVGPFAPTDLTLTPDAGQVGLTWASGGDNGSTITDYAVQYKVSASSTWTTFPDGTSATPAATVTGLVNGTNYNFRVFAINANGTSSASSIASAIPYSSTPAAPTANTVVISGTPSVGDIVTGTYTFSDINGDSEATSLFRWLRSDTAGGAYTAISGATTSSYTILADDLGKYLKFEVTPVSALSPTSGTPVLSAASAQVTDVSYINQILSTGQSLSVGVASNPALSTSQPYSNVMLSGAAGGLGLGTSFTALVESSVETMSSAMANTITANESGQDYDVAVGLHGVSGYTYSQLKKGTGPYANGMTQVTNTKNAATALGRTSRVIGVTTIHGETDNYNGVSGPAYQAFLEEWQHDYETDAKAITGQTGTIPLFLDQMSSFMSSYANTATSAIPIYQLKAAEDNPGKIYLVGPKYQYTYSDRHHLTAASSRWAGEYYGKVIKKVVVDHEAWRPLTPDSVVRSGNVIYANFHVPAGQLVFDTDIVSQRTNYGFEYFDASASATISSVQIHDADTVKITLSGTPSGSNQRLRYAYTGVPGTNTGSQNTGSAAGNLRDTDTFPSAYGNTLYNWAVHFDQAITVDATAPVLSNIVASSITSSGASIGWTTNETASSRVQYGLDTNYGLITAVTATSGVTTHSVTLSNLVPCTNYHYRVISADMASNQATSSDKLFSTAGCTGNATVMASSTATSSTAATSSLTLTTSGTEGIILGIPAGFTATSSNASFQANQLHQVEFFNAVQPPSSFTPIGGYVYNLRALIDATTTLSTFNQPITVTMSYNPAFLGSIDPTSLAIYRYDGSSWYPLSNCVIDTIAHTVSCTTTSFSDFGLFGRAQVSAPVSNQTQSVGAMTGGGEAHYGCKDINALNYEQFAASNPALCKYVSVKNPSTNKVVVRDLKKGMTGLDVKDLQRFLIEKNLGPAARKLSKNGATLYFGALTHSAVVEYQKVKRITPASGYVGVKTKAVMGW